MKSLNNYILEKLKLSKTSGKSDYVDLELPSGTLWCKYNVGVDPNKLETPEDWYGDYFKWGEIEKSADANMNDYSWWKANDPEKKFAAINFIKYNDKDELDELELDDDAAYNWNKLCVMPTKEQFEELVTNTEFEVFAPGSFGECYKGIEGLYGQLFKGKTVMNYLSHTTVAYLKKANMTIRVKIHTYGVVTKNYLNLDMLTYSIIKKYMMLCVPHVMV